MIAVTQLAIRQHFRSSGGALTEPLEAGSVLDPRVGPSTLTAPRSRKASPARDASSSTNCARDHRAGLACAWMHARQYKIGCIPLWAVKRTPRSQCNDGRVPELASPDLAGCTPRKATLIRCASG